MTTITPSLSYRAAETRLGLWVDGAPVAAVQREPGRVRVTLSLSTGRRARDVDVSPQPGTVPTLLRREARRRREDPNRWCAGVAGHLAADLERWGVHGLTADDAGDLDALLAGATYPLSRLARAAGCGPLPFAPRWAVPALLAPSPLDAVRAVLGDGATRAVARALPRGMVPPAGAPARAAPDLRPLGLAVSLRDHLDPDRLARVLAGDGSWFPSQHWPSDDDVRVLARLWSVTEPDGARALALDALAVPAGIARLRRALEIIETPAAVADLALARRLPDLEAQVERLRPTRAPATPPPPARPAAHPAPAPPPDPPLAVVPRRPPPAPRGVALVDGRFAHPPDVAGAHGYAHGDLRFVLPADADTLRQWGRRLSNCLADYTPAVRAGRSVVIGVEEQGRLTGALELTGHPRRVRQYVGTANARPDPARRVAVDRMLRDLGLVTG